MTQRKAATESKGETASPVQDRRHVVLSEVLANSQPSGTFFLLVALSTIIATFGLLSNSAAVIIGAMLVAPLMGPIMGMALGIADADSELTRVAGIAEILGALLAVAIAALIGSIPFHPEFGSEILARTQPTLYDLLIAAAAGIAGSYAMTNRAIGSALPGVAVAIALVPPLATTGLCVATRQWGLAAGSFLLFLVNFLCIEIAAAAVFTVTGVARLRVGEFGWREFLRRFSVSLIALAIATVFVSNTLIGLVMDQRLASRLRVELNAQLASTSGARLSEIHYEKNGSVVDVMAVVTAPQEVEPDQVARMETALRGRIQPEINLIVRSLVSKDADRQGPVFVAPSELAARESLREQSEFLAELSRLISSEVRRLPGVEVAQVTTNMTADGARKAIAVLRTPTPISPVQTASIERALNAVMKPPVSLVVRSLVTVDTSPAGYLYQPILEEDVLTGLELDLHERLTSEAKKVLPSIVVGSALLEVRFAYLDPSILVFASVETPTVFTPSQVRKLETSLRSKVNPKIQVVVRSVTGIVSSSRSYEHSFSEEAYDLRPRRPIAK